MELIDEAKLWLPTKFTDQWSKDWADQKGRKRSDRVQDSLAQETTWIVTVTHEKQTYAVATVTIEPKGTHWCGVARAILMILPFISAVSLWREDSPT